MNSIVHYICFVMCLCVSSYPLDSIKIHIHDCA